MKRLCVYCGSSPGNRPQFLEAAHALGKALVQSNIGLVYGGASVGMMGKIADTVLELGGEVIGVIPRSLEEKEVAHHGLTALKVVESMHERKSTMIELSDGFIAMPGGYGTLEELFEVLTWGQLGYHQKPCALLNVEHYYDQLIHFLNHGEYEGFIKEVHRDMLLMDENPGKLLELMMSYQSPATDKWVK